MHLTVVLPDLRIRANLGFDPCEGLVLPALQEILGRAQTNAIQPFSASNWLQESFGVTELGEAELTRRFDLPDGPSGYWLRADPVHLRADRDRVMLYESSVLNLRDDEAHALVASLNDLFSEDGLTFYVGTSSRWYLHLATAPNIATTPVAMVSGQDMHPYLPKGADALTWHRIMNEIQMLLYTHSINDQREVLGQAAVNSVWFWGEGAAPASVNKAYDVVIADGATPRALAAASGATHASIGDGFSSGKWSGKTLLWLDSLSVPIRHGDLNGWRDALVLLEAKWFLPLLNAWRAGEIKRLDFLLPDSQGARQASLSQNDRWRFWRRPLPMAKLAE